MPKYDNICGYCGNTFTTRIADQICCSRECSDNLRRKRRYDKVINKWLNNDMDYLSIKGKVSRGELNLINKSIIKDYLLKEQNYKCAICGSQNIWNNQELKFILNHIDGDWKNHAKTNLRLICPNCNSQLDTTKNNHGNGRYSGRHAYLKSISVN